MTWQIESAALARRIFRMLRFFSFSPQLHFVEHARLGGRTVCVLTLSGEDAPRLLTMLRMMEAGEGGEMLLRRTSPRPSLSRQCCRRAYLRGAFLGAGAITSPEKGYHLEIEAEDETLCQQVEKQLSLSGLPARHTQRRGVSVVYLKGAQDIADMLALMGASQAVMALENIRITRQMRAAANRASNCDEHNTERQLNASDAQIEAIKLVAIHRGLFTLPPALRAMAEARLNAPELSLQALGQSLEPPLSKSAAAHRMARLMAVAEEVRAEIQSEAT